MSDLPISGLPEATVPISADLMAIVVDNATIPVTKKITWANIKANKGAANSITSGLDADKSATPAVGDIYYATNTHKIYLCKTAETWNELVIATVVNVVTDTLKWSNDSEKSVYGTTVTKKKEIKLNEGLTVCRIKFGLRSTSASQAAYAQIYKNGEVLGTLQSQLNTTVVEKSEDFGAFATNDLIQIYAYSASATEYSRVSNLRLYFNRRVTKILNDILTTPLESSITFFVDPTNQDPA